MKNKKSNVNVVKTLFSTIIVIVLIAATVAIGFFSSGFRNWTKEDWENVWNDTFEDPTPEQDDGSDPEIEESAISLNMSSFEESVTVTATITPSTATNKKVNWSLAWKNASSSWASGKDVSDYVTVTPASDGALTANVNCLKAFGEQIKITVTSRANVNAKAECTLDYARRILDIALYSEDRDTCPLEFGSDEVLVDLVIPSYEDFISSLHDGTLWAGGYGTTWLYHGALTPEEENDPWTGWADEYLTRTFRFSDYTIKDNLIVEPENEAGKRNTYRIVRRRLKAMGKLGKH